MLPAIKGPYGAQAETNIVAMGRVTIAVGIYAGPSGFAAAAAKVAATAAFGVLVNPEAALPPLPLPPRRSLGSRDSHRNPNLLLL